MICFCPCKEVLGSPYPDQPIIRFLFKKISHLFINILNNIILARFWPLYTECSFGCCKIESICKRPFGHYTQKAVLATIRRKLFWPLYAKSCFLATIRKKLFWPLCLVKLCFVCIIRDDNFQKENYIHCFMALYLRIVHLIRRTGSLQLFLNNYC